MHITTKPNFNPVIITLETQEEVNILSDALYDLSDYEEETKTSFLRNLRVELYEHSSQYQH